MTHRDQRIRHWRRSSKFRINLHSCCGCPRGHVSHLLISASAESIQRGSRFSFIETSSSFHRTRGSYFFYYKSHTFSAIRIHVPTFSTMNECTVQSSIAICNLFTSICTSWISFQRRSSNASNFLGALQENQLLFFSYLRKLPVAFVMILMIC